MFRTIPAAEPAPDVIPRESPVPLSVLSLDLEQPPIGWAAYLGNIGVEIVEDDLGRPSIHRHDARRLIAEHRDHEVRRLRCVLLLRSGLSRLIRLSGQAWAMVCQHP
jgi:hypothetical protein